MSERLAIACLALIGYTYLGYPLVLWLLMRGRSVTLFPQTVWPRVSVIIAARNEEKCIRETLESLIASDYPAERWRVWVVSDASSDETDRIVSSVDPNRVTLLRQDPRAGKLSAQALGSRHADGDILIYADASSLFQPLTLRLLVRHFSDPAVGSVVGRKQIRDEKNPAGGEGAYWRYEGTLRHWESRTGSSWVGVEGGLYAIRKPLVAFDFPPDYAADYSVCCRVFEQGYRNRYEPAAIILEQAAGGLALEFSRKIRVIVRGIRAFFGFGYLLNPFRQPMFFFQNVSHRLLRWLVPFALLGLAYATRHGRLPVMRALGAAQVLFYVAALGGMAFKARGPFRWLKIPAYFVVTNAAALLSWFLLSRKYATWTPTRRADNL
jgi:biofilm PGA synthesis N-glycosyltransferase PgaC